MGNNCCRKKKLVLKELESQDESNTNINKKQNVPIINNYIYQLNSNKTDNNPNKVNSVNIDYKTFIKGKSYNNLLNEYTFIEYLLSNTLNANVYMYSFEFI